MKKARSLCFTKHGLINHKEIDYINSNKITNVILIGDGTSKGLKYIKDFDQSRLGSHVEKIGIAKLPLFQMRVVSEDGSVSKPHYLYDEVTKLKWFCSQVAAPHIVIFIPDPKVEYFEPIELPRQQVEDLCYISYLMWHALLVIEERLAFPAALINKLMELERSPDGPFLIPGQIDIEKFRVATGIDSLHYSNESDMLSVVVSDDIFTLKVGLLNDIFRNILFPFIESTGFETWMFMIHVKGLALYTKKTSGISFMDLGKIIESLRLSCQEKMITEQSPIEELDLIMFSEKFRTDDQACVWANETNTIKNIITERRDLFIR